MKFKSEYLKLQRCQKGEVTSNFDFNDGVGQNGSGVYAFMYGDEEMRKYYSNQGEKVYNFRIPKKYVVNMSRKKWDFWDIKAFIFNNPQYKAFIFKHEGHGIPTSKEVLITDISIIELL